MILLALVDLSCINCCFLDQISKLCSTNSCFIADVASDWLSCFPIPVQKHLYDVFFLDGSVVEVVQVLVPFLHHVENGGFDANSVQTNVERCPKNTLLFCFILCSFPLSVCLGTCKHKSLLLQQVFLLHDIFLPPRVASCVLSCQCRTMFSLILI